jgi:hypothetical protein
MAWGRVCVGPRCDKTMTMITTTMMMTTAAAVAAGLPQIAEQRDMRTTGVDSALVAVSASASQSDSESDSKETGRGTSEMGCGAGMTYVMDLTARGIQIADDIDVVPAGYICQRIPRSWAPCPQALVAPTAGPAATAHVVGTLPPGPPVAPPAGGGRGRSLYNTRSRVFTRIFVSICLSAFLSFYLPIDLLIYQSTNLPIYLRYLYLYLYKRWYR